ncbi:MAG: CCA tRNA nucleotidyltransferase [Planctomycetes bacterium]|nr:CCA tRNA nucleotidyltransferase [Planctomycetota bacterium]
MDNLKGKAVEILKTLRENGHQAFFAGGCVRDMLMSREPADYDIATDAHPDEVTAIFPVTFEVGAQFGVVLVVKESHAFEIATFRTEKEYADHRHPRVVEYANAEADVRRRDFTINAMLYDPIDDKLLDLVGGRNDITARVIRTVGDANERLTEDYLRMMRAVRFAARFGYTIEPATLEAIRENARKISDVSNERIGTEILKIFGGPNPHIGLQLLSDTRLLGQILPEVEAMKGVEQPKNFHPEGDVFQHTLLSLEVMDEARSPEFALAVLLHDVGKPPTFTITDRIRFSEHDKVGEELAGGIGRRLRLSNDQIEYIKHLVKSHMRFMAVREMRQSTLKRFLRDQVFDDVLELHRIDCLSSHRNLETWEFCKQKLQELGEEHIAPPRLLTGKHLIELGYEPGPLFKQMLSSVEDAQLEDRLHTTEEAIAFVLREFGDREHE